MSNPNGHHHHHGQHMVPANSAGDFSKGYMVNNQQSPNDVINRYKEVIRTQDEAFEAQKKQIAGLQATNAENKSKFEELSGEILQLKSQLALAQAQAQSNVRQIPEEEHLAIVLAKDNTIHELEEKISRLTQSLGGGLPSVKLAMQEEVIAKLEEENKQLVEEVESMKKDQEELLELLTEQDNRITEYKTRLRELGAQVEDDEDAEDELVPANMAAFDGGGGEDFLQ